ncbi:MAG TPA: DUF1566 domain-containing protein [bacterium]|nr:DUF1566 domain-containing protein [bacterium]
MAAVLLAAPLPTLWANALRPWTPVPVESRFVVLQSLAGLAVLDRMTNLIWEKSPSEGSGAGWANSIRLCNDRSLGGFGWRLPKIEELHTLADFDGVVAGAPFEHVDPNVYYISASEVPTDNGSGSTQAFAVKFGVSGTHLISKSTESHRVWCVKGGAN